MIHVIFRSHRIATSKLAVLAAVDLDHCSASMTENTVIMSGNIREESIRCNSSVQVRNIRGSKSTLEVMTKRQANRSTKLLRCILKSHLHALKVDPSKKGSHGGAQKLHEHAQNNTQHGLDDQRQPPQNH